MVDNYGSSIENIDWIIISFYISSLLIIGLIYSRRSNKVEEFFLASRDTGWISIGLSLFGSNMSSTAIIGMSGAAYIFGISIYNYEWSAVPIIVFFCIFLIPFILRSRVYTMPEYLELRYGVPTRVYFLFLTLFLTVFVDATAVLYCSALVVEKLFPNIPLVLIAGLLACAAGLFTLSGGLRAVIGVQAVQAIVFLIGATLISVTAFYRLGGWSAVMRGADQRLLHLIRPIDDPGVPWPGLLTGIPLLGFYFWCMNQYMVQRVLSARSIYHGRVGVLLAGLLKLLVLFLMIFPGICAAQLIPHLERADMVYPTLLVTLLPPGLTGLVVASFFAAAMVSIASTLHTASTLITMDLGRLLVPQASSERLTQVGRIATVFIVITAVTTAPQLLKIQSLWQYLQGVLAYATPPIVALFLVGMFWRGANSRGADVMLGLGTVASLILFYYNVIHKMIHLHFLYVAVCLFVFDAAILIGVSMAFRKPDNSKIDALVWTPHYFVNESKELSTQPLWKNYRLLSAALLILTAGVVLRFW